MERINEVKIKIGKFKIGELKAGDIQKWGNYFYLACPRCGNALRLEHDVRVEEGLVTISPSIGHPKTCNGRPNGCGLHIYVRKGKIEWLSDMNGN